MGQSTNPSGSPPTTTTMAFNVSYGLGKDWNSIMFDNQIRFVGYLVLNQLLKLQPDIVDTSYYVVSSNCGCEL